MITALNFINFAIGLRNETGCNRPLRVLLGTAVQDFKTNVVSRREKLENFQRNTVLAKTEEILEEILRLAKILELGA